MKIKYIVLSFFFISQSSFSTNRCFDETTNTFVDRNERISNCWEFDKRFDESHQKWFPTCKNSFASKLDPKDFGHARYLNYWCPSGIDRSVFSGLNYRWRSNEDECDLYRTSSRTASSFWLLKKIQQSGSNYGGHHLNNWHTRTVDLINEAGGINAVCDLDEIFTDPLEQIAYNNPFGIYLKQKFYFGVPLVEASMVLAHEAQHELENHIDCTRIDIGDQCDQGYEIYNPGLGFDDDNTYTISHWILEDSMKSYFIDEENMPERYLDKKEQVDENGNWQIECSFKKLLHPSLMSDAWLYISNDRKENFNIPKDLSPYQRLSDIVGDMYPKWICSPRNFCYELDLTFDLGDSEDRACNEVLNPANAYVNERNMAMCQSGLGSYIDSLSDPQNQGPEASRRIHQRESNRIISNLEQCRPITQDQLNQYCESRLNVAEDAFKVDEHGYLEKYGHSFSDLCVQRFCSLPRQQQLFSDLEEVSFTQLWNLLLLGVNEEESDVTIIKNNTFLNRGKCPEYFCGDDLDCYKRYFIYSGNVELATAESGSCTDEYLLCIDESGEGFNLEEYPDYIVPEEYVSVSGENELENIDLRSVIGYPCHEEYRSCKTRETVGIARLLSQMYLMKKENEALVKKVSLVDSKVNPSDYLISRLRKPVKELFTSELVFQISRLEKDPRNFKNSQDFYKWFITPEVLSKFIHYNPEAFLMFYPKEYAKHYAGDWIDGFNAYERENVLKNNPKLLALFESLDKDLKVHKIYPSKKIREILIKASSKLSEKDYKFKVQKLFNSQTVDDQLDNLKILEKSF